MHNISFNVLNCFDELEINEGLINSMRKTDRSKNALGRGFLIQILGIRDRRCEITVFLGELELSIFNYLDRKSSKSYLLFFFGSTNTRLVLLVYIDELRDCCKNFSCTIPLSEQYDMIANSCMYSLHEQKYVCFIY